MTERRPVTYRMKFELDRGVDSIDSFISSQNRVKSDRAMILNAAGTLQQRRNTPELGDDSNLL
jgi:hypothetical protein